MSNQPHDPAQPFGLPGTSAPAVPGVAPTVSEFRGDPVGFPPAEAPAPGAPTAPAAPPAFGAPVAPGSPGSVYVPPPTAYGQPQPGFGTGPAPTYGTPVAPPAYAAPATSAPAPAFGAPAPETYGVPSAHAPSPYAPAPPAYPAAAPAYPGAPPAYQQPAYPPQPSADPYHYGQPAPAGYQPPPLADQIPGAVAHETYGEERFTRHQPQLGPDGRPIEPEIKVDEPRGWNRWALIMLTIFLIALGALSWPQYRARSTEHELKPLVVGVSGPGHWARCPRYITSVFTYVGAVYSDSKGDLSDHTELTGPICAGLRHLYTPAGRAEMSCLVTTGHCSQSALNSVIALSTITHESMHLRGVLDEGKAECTSIAAAPQAAVLAGLTAEEGQMIGYLHLVSLNPNTPERYHLTPSNCQTAAELFANPPGTPEIRALLAPATERTWIHIASG